MLENKISINEIKKYNGKNVKIAIIDSGVEGTHSMFGGKELVADGVVIKPNFYDREHSEYIDYNKYKTLADKSAIEVSTIQTAYDGIDDNGHATALASIIHSIASEAVIYSIKILDKDKSTIDEILLEAIRWALDKDVDIINLSLGITDSSREKDFFNILSEADIKDVIVVLADNNLKQTNLLTNHSSVISVGSIETTDQYEFHHRQKSSIRYSAKGHNIPVAWKDNTIKTVSGNSFAAAHLTGIVALVKEYKPSSSCNKIKYILEELAYSSAKYKYNVYVSYSVSNKHDEKWGKWLLKDIDKYKYKNVAKKTSWCNDFCLNDEAEKALLSSEYLVVVYSGKVKVKARMEEEIQKFSEVNGFENIIFVDIEYEQDYFLDKYRDKSTIIDARPNYIREDEVKSSVLKELSTIIFKYSHDEFNRLKIRQIKNRIFALASAVLICGLSLGFGLQRYFGTTSKYYNEFTYQHAIPIGLNEIPKSKIKSRDIVYKIDRKMGKVIQISRINSSENLVDRDDNISVWIPSYRDNSEGNTQIMRIRCENRYGEVVYIKTYSENLNVIEIVDIDGRLQHSIDKDNSVAVFEIFYNDDGYISKELYYRDKNNNVSYYENKNVPSDEKKSYGRTLELNKNGQIIKENLLNKDYEIFISIEYMYNEQGDIVQTLWSDTSRHASDTYYNFTKKINEYDEHGNVVSSTYYNKNNQLIEDNNEVAKYVYEYDERGNIIKKSIFDSLGKNPGFLNVAATTVYEYDNQNRVIAEKYYNENGAVINLFGIHSIKHEYSKDKNGNEIVTTLHYDENGNITENTSSIAGTRVTRINENDIILYSKENLDTNTNIVSKENSVPIENKYYNKYYVVVKEEYLNFDRSRLFSSNNIAFITYAYDNYKRNTNITWHDKNTNIVKMEMFEYDELGRMVSKAYYGKNAEPAVDSISIIKKRQLFNAHEIRAHKSEWIYNEDGWLTGEFFLDTNLSPMTTRYGFHGITNVYDKYGYRISMSYLDTNRKAIEIDGIAGYDEHYNELERVTEYFDINGKSTIYKPLGIAKLVQNYDSSSIRISARRYDDNGRLSTNNYWQHAGYNYSYRTNQNSRIVYDHYENIGIEREPILTSDGYCSIATHYDDDSSIVERYYFGTNGEAVLNEARGYSFVKRDIATGIFKYYDEYEYFLFESYYLR